MAIRSYFYTYPELRNWLYQYLDEESVRLVWAYFRLRRYKRRKAAAQKANPTPFYVNNVGRAVWGKKPACMCATSISEIRQYGQALSVANYTGVDDSLVLVCTPAWAALCAEMAINSRFIPVTKRDAIFVQTAYGRIKVQHEAKKHVGDVRK